MYNPIRKWPRKGLALLLAFVLMTPIFSVQSNAYSVDYNLPESELPSLALGEAPASTSGAAFTNTTDDGGEDWISMTDARSFEAVIPVSMTKAQAEAAIEAGDFKWTLSRTEPYLSTDLYPNYRKGGDLDLWKDNSNKSLFKNISTGVYTIGADTVVKVTFDCSSYYSDFSVPHGGGSQRTMDIIGWYRLAAEQGGATLGSVAVKITPYDQFHTMGEVYDEMHHIVTENKSKYHYYVEEFSMGKSEMGYDMPYLIVAKDRAAVDHWLSLCERAETEPDKVLAELNAGTLGDYQVPVMYSNVHSNEAVSTDSILEFGLYVVNHDTISYDMLESFTADGKAELQEEMGTPGVMGSVAVPDLVSGAATYLGYLKAGNQTSGPVDLEKYYNINTKTVDVSEMLDDVFFILVPEENVEGRIFMTRTASGGLDLNRDNSFQTQNETVNMTKLIGEYNPVSFTELHGRITDWQIEPCSPPHEPNFEYDLLAEHLMTGGEAFGRAAVANNDGYNSYVTPERDYLYYTGNKASDDSDEVFWYPWDDMSTSYTPQWAMLHGTVSYTVEQPAYNSDVVQGSAYGQLGQADYVAENKDDYFKAQLKIYERGVTNANSDAYGLVGQWFCDQYDVEGAESELFRPEYDGPGQNSNFYPECYIIPLDQGCQTNLQAAADMMKWLTRNDVKILLTKSAFTYKGQTYPAGTMIVPMYQAKRSVANSALYDGTFINHWTELYSEGITTFNETRGFDMAVCAEPSVYTAIKGVCGEGMDYEDCLTYLATVTSSLLNAGYSGYQVIISNASEDSTAAVNALLKAGRTVGMITEGSYEGDFICSYTDWVWLTASDGPNKDNHFILSGTCINRGYPAAKIITKSPLVYINGDPGNSTSGYIHNTQVGAGNYNYDRQSMDLLNFNRTKDPMKADVILGASAIDTTGSPSALSVVQGGTPYIGYGSGAASNNRLKNFFDGISRKSVGYGSMDALPYVTYPAASLINASYVMDNDDVMYGYGAGYFDGVPSGASILVRVDPARTPTEGFMNADDTANFPAFLDGSIQGFSYEGKDKSGKDIDVAFFANSLTHKVNQRDEFAFISNFAFSNVLGGDYTAREYEPGGSGSHSGSGSSTTSTTPASIEDELTSGEAVQLAADTFDDVDENAWYAESVGRMIDLGLMNGTASNTFSPGSLFNRGMIATVLYRLAGSPAATGSNPFSDVSDGAWYYNAVVWGSSSGIITGYDGSYAPDGPVTREQVATILYRYAISIGKNVSANDSLAGFTDRNDVSDFSAAAMNWAVANGIITGSDDKMLNPKATAARAEVAAMLMRAIDIFRK